MNKIVKKAVTELDKLRRNLKEQYNNAGKTMAYNPKNVPLEVKQYTVTIKFVDILEKILMDDIKKNDELYTYSFIDNFETIRYFCKEVCRLDNYEIAEILNIIIKHNMNVILNNNKVILNPNHYSEQSGKYKSVNEIINEYNDYKTDKKDVELTKQYIEDETLRTHNCRTSYSNIKEFKSKYIHTEIDYKKIEHDLKIIGLTDELIKYYVAYLRNKDYVYKIQNEKKEQIKPIVSKPVEIEKPKDNLPSKRKLKERLSELYKENYDDQNNPYFDINDIYEVVDILEQLDYSKERFEKILRDIYRNTIKNEDFNYFIVYKLKYLNANDKILNEIEEYKNIIEEFKIDNEMIKTLKRKYTDIYSGDKLSEALKELNDKKDNNDIAIKEATAYLNHYYLEAEYYLTKSFDYEKEELRKRKQKEDNNQKSLLFKNA